MDYDKKPTSKKSLIILIPAAALTVCLAIGGIAYVILTRDNKGTSAPAQGTAESEMEAGIEKADLTDQPDSSDFQNESSAVQDSYADVTKDSENQDLQDNSLENEGQVDKIIPSLKPDRFYNYNGHTYGLYNAKDYDFYSYYKCADFCRQQGGHLAVINDDSENEFLYDIISTDYKITAFFGYSDEEEEGAWKWSDGQSDYENWTRFGDWDLPDNGEEWGGNEDYAEFNYDAVKDWIPNDTTWNDAPFMENTSLFICEWDYEVD